MTGFVITLDALIAVMVASLMIGSAVQLMTARTFTTDDYLLSYSYDFLTVAEKSDSIDLLLDGNFTKIADMLNRVQPSICLRLEVTTVKGERVYLKRTWDQRDCEGDPSSFISAVRVVPHGDDIYLANAQAWY